MHGAREFHYRPAWRVASGFPGAHHGRQRGGGYEMHSLAPLLSAGDPRRFDMRASLRDPFGRLLVRNYRQRGIVPVVALADVSASMGFVGHACKYDLLIEFSGALAYSAFRAGDPFAFTACDTRVRDDMSLPLTRAAGAGAALAERLRQVTPVGRGAAGLLHAAERLPARRALVFLISDFYLPPATLRGVLDRLSPHAVIPVVLRDSAEAQIAGPGIAHLFDPETGQRRLRLLRASVAQRLRDRVREQRRALEHCLAGYHLRPLYVVDRFEPEAVSRYFYG